MSESKEELPRFIVMDIIFKGRSLNYDQGAGNYQELKKITKFDGQQYTMVSRYALRYSILETGKRLGFWGLYKDFDKPKKKRKEVWQPKVDDVISGKVLGYPEFDLFGFMITTETGESNFFRESPVKISHAISLTPFNYDTHMSGNHFIAKRVLESGKMEKINLFTREEHDTYYGYTVVIDTEKISTMTLYMKKDEAKKITKESVDVKVGETNVRVKISKEPIGNKDKIVKVTYTIEGDKKDRIKKLIEATLSATREIKGSTSSLKPHLLVLGVYDKNYDTHLDRISLDYQYEQIVETIEEPLDANNPGEGVRKIERVKVTRVPKFVVPADVKPVEVKYAQDLIHQVLEKAGLNDSKNAEMGIYVFKLPYIEVETLSGGEANNE